MPRLDHHARHLPWGGCDNARDVGGYPTVGGGLTRWRTLVRSDGLHSLTPEGEQALAGYGINTIVDLRLQHELEKAPNPFDNRQAPGHIPAYVNVPMHDLPTGALLESSGSTQASYVLLLERGKEPIAAIIEAVAAGLERGAVLVHCHGGKDRTGVIVALLLAIVGVPHRTIAEDYALSEKLLEPRYLEWVQEQVKLHGSLPEKPWRAQTRPETMRATLDYLDRQYGGAEGYLRVAGVSQAGIELIRTRLVEPAAGAGC